MTKIIQEKQALERRRTEYFTSSGFVQNKFGNGYVFVENFLLLSGMVRLWFVRCKVNQSVSEIRVLLSGD